MQMGGCGDAIPIPCFKGGEVATVAGGGRLLVARPAYMHACPAIPL